MRVLIAAAVSAPLCACGLLEDDVAQTHDRSWYFNTPSAFMTADARIVTQRYHPVTGKTVVCVEPSPDAIKAISKAGTAGLKGGNGAVTGGIDLSGTSNEAAAELAGRSTALLGLREGLFRACEAYANGIIGADAYGLILAKYAPTMTTLFLAQDVAGTASVARASINSSPGAQPASGTSPSAPASQTPSKPAASAAASLLPRIWPVAIVVPAGTEGAAPAAGGAPAPQKDAKPKNTPTKPAASSSQAAAPVAEPGATAALSLVRMNEDYMLQPQSVITTLLVACIEQNDPSRYPVLSSDTPPKKLHNEFLKPLCANMASIDDIARYSEMFGKLGSEMRLVEPVAPPNTSSGPSHK